MVQARLSEEKASDVDGCRRAQELSSSIHCACGMPVLATASDRHVKMDDGT